MSYGIHQDAKPAWSYCRFCEGQEFTSISKFMKHLREKHCAQEGGSFVCRYGENNVCCTLPVEGVSDADYERHVYKHHTTAIPFSNQARKVSSSSTSSDYHLSPDKWTVFSAAQNLAAVLNDPKKGKQKDFFTKTWGDSFVEVTEVPPPNYLPQITRHHFEHYLKKIAKRHKKHLKLNAALGSESSADITSTFPSLRIRKFTERNQFDINVIPKIFLQPNFDLSNLETFNAVFPHITNHNNNNHAISEVAITEASASASTSAKLLQEKLTHYLDLVEVQIAQQVAQKSDAFFHAMTSHDVLMEQLGQTVTLVRALREKIQKIDNDVVKSSLVILRNERLLHNNLQVYRKLKIMAAVMQTQPTIQLMLSIPDYVGAIDLIHATEHWLKHELAGIQSFRHLNSELKERLKLIDSLMSEELERYCSSDLNRPFSHSDIEAHEGEKLTCIVLGLLRRRHLGFVDTYQREIISAVKAAVKQAAIEVVADSDAGGGELDEQLKYLSIEDWIRLHYKTGNVLLKLCKRVKRGCEIMSRAADISAGKQGENPGNEFIVSESGDWVLPSAEHDEVKKKLQSLLVFVCDYSQNRCVQLLSDRTLFWPDEKKEDSQNVTSWLAERATLSQLKELSQNVSKLSEEWADICSKASINLLKGAFHYHAKKFMYNFHLERTTKLFLILDKEPWKKADVPATFQKMVDLLSEQGTFSKSANSKEEMGVANELRVGDENYAVVGAVLILLKIIAEYCCHAEEIPLCADTLLRYIGELLIQFNSKCSKLILGAEAVSENTGLKRITIINLALLLRALQFVKWLIPYIRLFFQGLIGEEVKDNFDDVTNKIKAHADGVLAKILDIMRNTFTNELKNWDAKPPIPSKPFQNICKQLTKLHEAVNSVMPRSQIQDLYVLVNANFKDVFRDKLQQLGIVNDGSVVHGYVTSELLFYLKDLKSVNALPPQHLDLDAMNDIWPPRLYS